MLKRRAFTIIEVLTTITILAIVATISVPEYWRWRDRDEYRSEGQALFDSLLNARNAALTNKFCSDGSNAVRWSVFIDTDSEPMSYQMRCYSDDTTFTNESEAVEMNNSVLETLDFNGASAPPVFNVSGDYTESSTFPDHMLVSFFTGGVNGRLEYTKVANQTAETFAMVIGHDDSAFVHTLCFNRVAGFPSFNKTGNDCVSY